MHHESYMYTIQYKHAHTHVHTHIHTIQYIYICVCVCIYYCIVNDHFFYSFLSCVAKGRHKIKNEIIVACCRELSFSSSPSLRFMPLHLTLNTFSNDEVFLKTHLPLLSSPNQEAFSWLVMIELTSH